MDLFKALVEIEDRSLRRFLLACSLVARQRGEGFLGLEHIFLYLIQKGLLKDIWNIAPLLEPFSEPFSKGLTEPLKHLLSRVTTLEQFLELLTEKDLFRWATWVEAPKKIAQELKEGVKTDAISFLKTLGTTVPTPEDIWLPQDLIQKMLRVLLGEQNTGVVLVGPPGVGKTSLVQGLQSFLKMALPSFLVIELSGDARTILDRITAFLDENVIVFIDEAQKLLRDSGSPRERVRNFDLLKPLISSGALKLILAGTERDLAPIFEDQALIRRFTCLRMSAPLREKVLEMASRRFPHYSPEFVAQAYDLAERWIRDQAFPGKLIKILAYCQGESPHLLYEAVAFCSGKPEELVSGRIIGRLPGLLEFLKARILGQNNALEEIVQALGAHYATSGLRQPKPLAFLFCGPTGVGKTETAKALASFLKGDASCLFRLDMNEYAQQGDVWKLLGSSPGFVGSSEEPLLSRILIADPAPILLFDEIEKADPSVQNALLRLLDEGVIRDNHGRELHFEDAMIILTTNAGAREFQAMPVGFKGTAPEPVSALLKYFSPEFLSRLKIIFFKPLDLRVLKEIVQQKIARLSQTAPNIFDQKELVQRVLKRLQAQSLNVRAVEQLVTEEIWKMWMERANYVVPKVTQRT